MFDINTAIGHWPFRRVPNQTAGKLRAILEAKGIRGAAVAHTHGLFYKNCHDANRELAEAIAPHGEFFVGVGTLNPRYAAWERDLPGCKEDLGFKALRLAPQYHNYRLGAPESVAIARAATELGLPILVPHRVVDLRQRHWLDADRAVDLDELAALLGAVPACRIVVTEWRVSPDALTDVDGNPKFPGLYVETSRFPSAYQQHIARLADAIGSDHVLFGTGAPLKSITSAILKLEHADVSDEVRQQIAAHNARHLLGIADP